MTTLMQEPSPHRFAIGLLAGAFIGVGLAMWLAPRWTAELRRRATDSAKQLGELASDQYAQVSARVAETVDDLAHTGQDIRNGVADAVAGGAQKVERYAMATKREHR